MKFYAILLVTLLLVPDLAFANCSPASSGLSDISTLIILFFQIFALGYFSLKWIKAVRGETTKIIPRLRYPLLIAVVLFSFIVHFIFLGVSPSFGNYVSLECPETDAARNRNAEAVISYLYRWIEESDVPDERKAVLLTNVATIRFELINSNGQFPQTSEQNTVNESLQTYLRFVLLADKKLTDEEYSQWKNYFTNRSTLKNNQFTKFVWEQWDIQTGNWIRHVKKYILSIGL